MTNDDNSGKNPHYGGRHLEVLHEPPAHPLPTGLTRRQFSISAAIAGVATGAACGGGKKGEQRAESGATAEAVAQGRRPADASDEFAPPESTTVPNNILAQCPYCGVGCGTLIQTEKGKIVGMMPDPKHPTNNGLQCIKGLASAEAIYVDRLTKPLIRRDMTDQLTGHESATKGRFSDDVFREATWEEADEIIVNQIVGIYKKFGGNSIGLYGSGQLPVEGQWLENLFMKGVLGSNTIEANARMCMTSAVTGYFKSLGSDTPPTAYEDIELADMVTHWGHNARGSHPIVFWRIADHKANKKIPTLVVDPRRTGTVMGYEEVNEANSYHFSTINGDIAIQNAIAHVLLTSHEEAIAWDFLKGHSTGWEDYVKGVTERYAPEKVQHITMIDPKYLREVAAIWAEASIKGRKNGKGGVLSVWGIGYNQHIHGQNNTVSLIKKQNNLIKKNR